MTQIILFASQIMTAMSSMVMAKSHIAVILTGRVLANLVPTLYLVCIASSMMVRANITKDIAIAISM